MSAKVKEAPEMQSEGVQVSFSHRLEQGQTFSTVCLLKPIRVGAKLLDGTISPDAVPDHHGIVLKDAGRFLEVAMGDQRRWVPWVHVAYATPAGAG